VLTDDGGRVDLNDSTIVGDDHRGLTVHLRPGLPQGFYTVSWQNVATDGDGLTGSYRFGVGIIHPLNVEPLESGDTD
jgi:methionine-rich copper-binding protein CopC